MSGPFTHSIDPVIGQLGPFYLWWYGLSYTLGFLVLFIWLRGRRASCGLDLRQVYDLNILVVLGVLVGGRLVEVLFYERAFYGEHPWYGPAIWLGGMSTHGTLFGGMAGAWLFCRLNRKGFIGIADGLVVPVALMLCLGRIGNFIDGQIVGSPGDVPWAVRFPDADGFRHPVVLYDALKNLLLVPPLLWLQARRVPRGVMLGSFLFGYGFFRIFVDLFREYRVEMFGLPPGQLFNTGMSLAGLALIMMALRGKFRDAAPLPATGRAAAVDMAARVTFGRRLLLGLLLAVPLVIPGDWTQDVPARYGKRHGGMEHSWLYPPLPPGGGHGVR